VILGVDLDNTLCCYDGVFYAAAVASGLISPQTPPDKCAVREALLAADREEDWTRLQGEVYGPGMAQAKPFPGAKDCLAALTAQGVSVHVVSHRTRHPHRGPQYDLHAAALRWLEVNGFFDPAVLSREAVFLETSADDKVARIAALGCSHFIDDLPRIFTHPSFPQGVVRILLGEVAGDDWRRFSSWWDMALFLQGELS